MFGDGQAVPQLKLSSQCKKKKKKKLQLLKIIRKRVEIKAICI